MRISFNWLRQWVPTDLDAETVAERLTRAGLEVDELITLGESLDCVVVGEIVECRAHPDADRLRICEVEHGRDRPATVVCGAPNARVGLKAPLAEVGARLPGGREIRAAELRGVASEGMLCSVSELGLGEDATGLLELPDTAETGRPLAEALGLPDHVLVLDLTPNRADCLSVRGVARELAAIESLECHPPAIEPVPAASGHRIPIELVDPADCPRYVGRLIDSIDPAAATPAWMVERLERSGLRSRGPIVDATNYVLLELGQPMHAFDADVLEGGIRVRRARSGDSITLLDGQQVTPDPDMLLICDHARPVALAGIMGGADSAVGEGTRNILLESAWFSPAAIVGRARRLGLATDSAHRFERGVDPQLQRDAIERATALILEVAGGTPGPVIEQVADGHLPETREIELRLDRLNRLLGTDFGRDRVRSMLERLGMQVADADGALRVVPPSARRDLAIEVDLIEEVARLVGYDALPARAPGGRLRPQVASEREIGMDRLRVLLHARGFQEIMTWSFVAEDDLGRLSLDDGAWPLANPLSREMGVLRTSLVPGLAETAAANFRHQHARLKLFETGHVFGGDRTGESERLGLLVGGAAEPENWLARRRDFDFFDIKGEVEHLLAGLGHSLERLECRNTDTAWLHPGQACELVLAGQPAGLAGQLHPAVAGELGLDETVFVAEIELEVIRRRPLPEYAGTARYPSVRRDLALLVPESVPAAEIGAVARRAAGTLLERCIIFDKYQGKEIESGYKSLAIGLIFRELSRTLTDEDVDSAVRGTVKSLQQECNVRLRG